VGPESFVVNVFFPDVLAILLGSQLSFLPPLAQDVFQLPQIGREITLVPRDRLLLADLLVRGDATRPPELTPVAEQALLRSLPPSLRDACREMMKPWGTLSIGTERWNARLLHWTRDAERVYVLVVFRCSSSNEGNAGYFDERPAALTLEKSAARLQFFPLEATRGAEADLYHVEFSQQFAVERGMLLEIAVASSNDNPALGVVDARAVERLHYVLLPEAVPVLTIVRRSEFLSHDDQAGDAEDLCEVNFDYRRDSSGRLTEIIPDRACKSDFTIEKPPALRFRWNPARRSFDSRPVS